MMRLGKGAAGQGTVRVGLESLWREGASLRRLRPWGLSLHHLNQAARGLWMSPVTSLLTVVTIAVSLTVLGVVILGLENAGRYLTATQQDVSVSIFLKDRAGDGGTEGLRRDLEAEPAVLSVSFVGKREALEEFRRSLGQETAILEGLEKENPLPASFVVKLRETERRGFSQLAEKYRKNPLVDQVQFNEGLVGQLGTLIRSFRFGGIVAVMLVLVMSASIIGSAIKLALYSRRDEVEIMQLVGASTGFIRAPYVIEGALQGAIGSGVAIGLVFILCVVLNHSIAQSTILSLVMPEVGFLGAGSRLLMLCTGVLVGIGGSYAALRGFRAD